MGNGAFEYGNLNQVFLGRLNALGDSRCYFAGLTQTVTDNAIAITYNDNSSERKGTTTLCYLGNTVDGTKRSFNSASLFTLTLFIAIIV